MAGNLTDTAENLVLDWLNPEITTPTRPTSSLQVALITTDTPSTDSSAGSEVTNTGGSTYARVDVTFTAGSGGTSANDATLSFTGMPACTVGGVEIWDSAGTPVRLWYGTLTANKTVNAGDTFEIATGDLDLTLD